MNGSIAPAPAVPMCEKHPSRFAESCQDCAADERKATRLREYALETARSQIVSSLYGQSMIEIALKGQLMRSCLNCDHFKNDLCHHRDLSVPTQPPPKIIMFGCDGHSEEIPF